MWAALAAGCLAAGAGCLLRSEYEKNHFVVEEIRIASPKYDRKRSFFFSPMYTIRSSALPTKGSLALQGNFRRMGF